MRRNLFALSLAIAVVVLSGGLAHAHRGYFRSYLLSTDGTRNAASLEVRPTVGGRLKLDLLEPLPGTGTGTMVIDAALNRVPLAPLTYAIDTKTGQQRFALGFDTANQDKLEILGVAILDENGTPWAALGAVGPQRNKSLKGKYLLCTAIIYVADTASNVAFTRGGDTTLLPNGFWTVGFDALRDKTTGAHLDNDGNYAEIEFSRNGGPWEMHSVSFDVRSGKSQPSGRPNLHFGFAPGDRIVVKRVEVFDSAGNMFAKIGVRLGQQGNYVVHSLDRTIRVGENEPHAH